MGYQVYQLGNRFCGYGVPSYCEHPDCNEEIDRGLAYCCGGEPNSEYGCGRYFCEKHRQFQCFDQEGNECNHTDDCFCECVEVCERCAKGKEPFDYKTEHPSWKEHLLTDKSWAIWREENPEIVKELKKD